MIVRLKEIARQLRPSKGQTMVEYALILATVALVVVSFYSFAGAIVATLVGAVNPLF